MSGFDSFQRYTPSNNFDTSGTASGEMRATAQHFSGVYRLDGNGLTHHPEMSSEDIYSEKTGLEATAQTPSGWGAADMSDPKTIVTINGVQASIEQFQKLGLIEKQNNGEFKAVDKQPEPMAKDEPKIEEDPDGKVEPFHPEIEADVQHFVKAMHPTALGDALDQAVNAIVTGSGEIDTETLAKLSDQSIDKAHDGLQKFLLANQVRANAILEQSGIPPEEHQQARKWAMAEAPQQLQKAMSQLLKNRNGNGIRKLAAAYKQDQILKGYQR